MEENQNSWREWIERWRGRIHESWRDRRGRKLLLGFSALALVSCGTGAIASGWTRACVGTCPTAEQVASFAPRQASQVLDARGNLMGNFYRERRTLIPLEGLPRYVPMAFVAIEDQRFFEHEGVDPLRMVAAVRDNVIGGWGGPGGSTITMQLARNLFPQQLPRGEKTIRRKVAEIKLALEMERTFSKPRILGMYLNHIYLGAGAYGIEAASRTYFAKPATRLNYVEAATLAALPKAPSFYDPRRNPEGARMRRDLVLDAMARTEVITPAQARAGKAQALSLAPPRGAIRAPYFVEAVRRELEDRFGELLYTGGLR
ncbi:MAG: transglycosylase domain-containing protein, partial [Gemmatimonadota bacterium]|nr:transglycosylase domain-containing protein [Gemmatimonadota bacterium]